MGRTASPASGLLQRMPRPATDAITCCAELEPPSLPQHHGLVER